MKNNQNCSIANRFRHHLFLACLLWIGCGTSVFAADTEWKSLFDGKTTTGWRGIGKKQFPDKGWVVEDACLKHVKNGGGGDIITTEEYSNFEFEWEWKISKGANSGVKYMIIEKRGAIGHEYQIWDAGNTALNIHSTASLYDMLAPIACPQKPIGEFNTSKICVKDLQVEHWLNGVKVLSYQLDSPELKAAVAKSKFKGFAGFGSKVKGPILLQDHGGEIYFRNLRIRELQ